MGKWQEEGGDLSCVGQLGANGKILNVVTTMTLFEVG